MKLSQEPAIRPDPCVCDVALSRPKRQLSTTQKLARHSAPKLTSNTYAYVGLTQKAVAIGRLPACPNPLKGPPREASARQPQETNNGRTDGICDEEKGEHPEEPSGGDTRQKSARCGESALALTMVPDLAQVLALSRNDNRQQVLATAGESEAEGARTLNHRIDSPVL